MNLAGRQAEVLYHYGQSGDGSHSSADTGPHVHWNKSEGN